MNAEVGAYSDLCEALARKVAGSPRAKRMRAEYDDLLQEGLINVWQTLERGIRPSAALVEMRMRSYVRWLGRPTAIPYEALLPLDDFAHAAAV